MKTYMNEPQKKKQKVFKYKPVENKFKPNPNAKSYVPAFNKEPPINEEYEEPLISIETFRELQKIRESIRDMPINRSPKELPIVHIYMHRLKLITPLMFRYSYNNNVLLNYDFAINTFRYGDVHPEFRDITLEYMQIHSVPYFDVHRHRCQNPIERPILR